MSTETILKQTPLYQDHLSLGARVIGFGGWEMPVSYEGIIGEYENTRRGVSVFDTCHMGEFLIEGDCRKSGLDRLVTQKISDMPPGSCRYGMTLNDQGGIIDDLVVYRIEENKWMVVVNGATTDKDEAQFVSHLTEDAAFKNVSRATGKLDIQGPLSRDVLKSFIPGIEKLNYYEFAQFDFLGGRNIVSRTGYTGELGFEIYFPWDKIPQLWKKLLENPAVKPAGLGARDVLRLEMGYSLYGQDIDETVSPLEAGLGRFVDFEKDFIGKGALIKQKNEGAPRKSICFISQTRQSPRHHHKIYDENTKEVGTVTSGGFSVALKKGIGIGLVLRSCELKGKTFFAGDEKNKIPVELFVKPFYKSGTLKN